MLTKNEIKYIRLLQEKKHRDQENRFVVEGSRSVIEFIKDCPDKVETVFATAAWLGEHKDVKAQVLCREIAVFEAERLSALKEASPVIAVLLKPENTLMDFNATGWNLVLDGIQDPGNLGSIIRIADWFGLHAIWCSPDCTDAFNPKVVQATMGSLARIKVVYTPLEQLLGQSDMPVYASTMQGESLFEVKAKKGILMVGNEGHGVRENIMRLATHKITIPRIGQAESLNAAVATGIMIAKLTAAPEKPRGH
jgi:RNA methyltransferase, TrmH family